MNGGTVVPNGATRDDRFQNSLDVTNNRVSTLEKSVGELASSQERLGLRLSSEITNVATSLSGEIRTLAGQFADRSKIPWPALGVMLAFITTIGGLVWYPVKDKQDKVDAAIQRLADTTADKLEKVADNAVTKSDLEYRLTVSGARRDEFQRQSEARDTKLENVVEQIRDKIVPRGEHEEKWRGNDQRFVDMQRQIDEQKRAFGDTFSLRDALQQMQKRIDALETVKVGR
ncbi:hypothetical protein [Methylorubrum populi]|uniref:Uncharacterized protein n=1 Tax=Methylorubrum populi TaxID=223967 RepID=A0A833JA42_9HYPH|nr:hypothetical protein [Methylorubrum populi]KAB7788073.1 hypothetical protein F8B43_0078 [Methylorubrum populi]